MQPCEVLKPKFVQNVQRKKQIFQDESRHAPEGTEEIVDVQLAEKPAEGDKGLLAEVVPQAVPQGGSVRGNYMGIRAAAWFCDRQFSGGSCRRLCRRVAL